MQTITHNPVRKMSRSSREIVILEGKVLEELAFRLAHDAGLHDLAFEDPSSQKLKWLNGIFEDIDTFLNDEQIDFALSADERFNQMMAWIEDGYEPEEALASHLQTIVDRHIPAPEEVQDFAQRLGKGGLLLAILDRLPIYWDVWEESDNWD